MEDNVNSTSMIHYIQPVAYVLALTIYREKLAVTNVVDEEWNQLLRKLVRTIVVRAVGHDSGHTVGIVKSTNEVITRGLRCTIRAMRIILGILIKEILTISEMPL